MNNLHFKSLSIHSKETLSHHVSFLTLNFPFKSYKLDKRSLGDVTSLNCFSVIRSIRFHVFSDNFLIYSSHIPVWLWL